MYLDSNLNTRKTDFDDEEKTELSLQTQEGRWFTSGHHIKRKLFDFLFKKGHKIVDTDDKYYYTLVPPIIIEYPEDEDVERYLFKKYFSYTSNFEDYFERLVDSLCKFETPHFNDILDCDLAEHNKRIYDDLKPLRTTLEVLGFKLEKSEPGSCRVKVLTITVRYLGSESQNLCILDHIPTV